MNTPTTTMSSTLATKRKKESSVIGGSSVQGSSLEGRMPEISTSEGSDEVAAGSPRKRKRDAKPASELEIDILLPEPPSKKTLRKAKKQKTGETTTATSDHSTKELVEKKETSKASDATPVSEAHSAYGIWIGNLPFTITKPLLRSFLTSSESGSTISDAQITRVHMPAPANAVATKTQLKPLNKGFAYVDFVSKEALNKALALSETLLGGRNVLIKNSKSFEGRPEKKMDENATEGEMGKAATKKMGYKTMKPTKRVFVGNLGFDVTKEDLNDHYNKCGEIVDIHMATFEDSGKCKGFAWVTFGETEAAEAAVRGWVRILEPIENDSDEKDEQNDSRFITGSDQDESDTTENPNKSLTQKMKKQKMRKWFVNRLLGREIRCEFAEDASSRYKKRFGKEAVGTRLQAGGADVVEMPADHESNQRQPHAPVRKKASQSMSEMQPGAPTDRNKRRGKIAGQPDLNYRTGAITESAGTKVKFT